MIWVSVEVRSGGASFRSAVSAESIEQAVRLADARYPGSEVRVIFPIDPEAFFRAGSVLVTGHLWPEILEEAPG